MARKFLGGIHGEKGAIDVDVLYSEWAATYEQEVLDAGYITPARCAEMLKRHGGSPDDVILDYGCGTGLSGQALKDAGFGTIEGADITKAMLDEAEARSGVYHALHLLDPDASLPFAQGHFKQVVAAGVITPHHAPPETLDVLLNLLDPGGLLVFSLNDQALSVPAFPDHVESLTSRDGVELVDSEYGPHLPKMNMGATVYAVRHQ